MKEIISEATYQKHIENMHAMWLGRLITVTSVITFMIHVAVGIVYKTFLTQGLWQVLWSNLVSSLLFGTVFSVGFTQMNRFTARKIMNFKPKDTQDMSHFDLMLQATYVKSNNHMNNGSLFISKKKLVYIPQKVNLSSDQVEWDFNTSVTVRIEEVDLPRLTRWIYKHQPQHLVLDDGARTERFIVPSPETVLEALVGLGLKKKKKSK